jgi:hypothetical protein
VVAIRRFVLPPLFVPDIPCPDAAFAAPGPLRVRDYGVTVNVVETAGLPPLLAEALIVTGVLLATVLVLTVNVAELVPACTSTEAGTEAEPLLLNR